ncbi:MAG: GvpL/GvpF family gas vesicle protein [Actinomycetes bacterium]
MPAVTDGSIYFYGVIRGDHAGPLAGLTAIGGQGEVFGMSYRELTVVVSEATAERYEVSRANVLGHEAVVSSLMADYTLLPGRFGSVRKKDSIIEELLVPYYEPLLEQLTRVDGKVEVSLIVRWASIQPAVAEIVAADPWLRNARRRLQIAKASQNMKLDVGKRIEQALAAKRFEEAAAIVFALKAFTPPDGVHLNEPGEEAKVLDGAFLITRDSVQEFTEAVTDYDAQFGGRYLMSIGAPAAPYGFVPSLEASIPRQSRPRRRDRVRR